MIPVSSAVSDPMFSMDDINASLQMEYQSQLVLQPQTERREKLKKVVVKNPLTRQQLQTQQRITSAHVHQPKAKVPSADELFEAATHGNVNMITRLLQQGVNVNSANSERETALHMAAANGRYPAVIYLLNHGANINARTTKNWLPIHHATRFRKANIANYLMKKGALPYARTSDGLSAIDMARSLGDQQLLRILGAK
jgi:ankyrin repeat protein